MSSVTATPIMRTAPPIHDSATMWGMNRAVAFTALGMVGTFALAFGVLGSTVNWPASLQLPAAVALPLIRAQAGAVAFGYSSYLVSSLLGIALALLLGRALAVQSALLSVATGFGVLAGAMKILGIVRWIVLMPTLAQTYTDPATSAATRDTVAVVYTAFNHYAGGVGEQLGDVLFTALWIGIVSLIALRPAALPMWLNILGGVSAIAYLIGLGTNFGLPVTAANLLGNIFTPLWLLALAVVLLRRPPVTGR